MWTVIWQVALGLVVALIVVGGFVWICIATGEDFYDSDRG